MSDLRYTLNPDGTIETWYLEKDSHEGYTALRKTKMPKYNCCMRIFVSNTVYCTRREAKEGIVGQKFSFHAESEG